MKNDFLCTSRQLEVRLTSLNLMGSVVICNQVAQNKLSKIGVLSVILESITCPKFLSTNRDKQKYPDVSYAFFIFF